MILVTGASGHLGNVLIRELLADGEKIRAMVLPGETIEHLLELPVELFYGDILEPVSLRGAMQEVDTVFHLAGVIAIRPGMEDTMRRVNVEGTRNVAEAALECGIKRMIHVSSVHAFRRAPHGVVMDENTPLALDCPAGSYDRTKAEGTRAVLDAVARGLNAVIICPSGIIGRHDYLASEMGRTLLSFTDRLADILVDGSYDFVDVRDVARGLILARDRGKNGEIYILSGSQITIEELHRLAQQSAGIRVAKIKLTAHTARFLVGIAQHFFYWLKIKSRYTIYSLQTLFDNSLFSSQKAFRELGYRPRPLAETVADFITWHRAFTRQKKENLKLRGIKIPRAKTARGSDCC